MTRLAHAVWDLQSQPSPASIFVFTHLAEDEPVETGLEGAASGFPGSTPPHWKRGPIVIVGSIERGRSMDLSS